MWQLSIYESFASCEKRQGKHTVGLVHLRLIVPWFMHAWHLSILWSESELSEPFSALTRLVYSCSGVTLTGFDCAIPVRQYCPFPTALDLNVLETIYHILQTMSPHYHGNITAVDVPLTSCTIA
jgi:hypothetical protein